MTIPVLSYIEVVARGLNSAGQEFNVWTYQLSDVGVGDNAADIAQGWWDEVKVNMRAVYPTSATSAMVDVTVRELNNPAGEYGTYAIPAGEQPGTRAPGAQAEFLQPYAAVAARLVVANRSTRPGQKRFGHLVEGDQSNGTIQAGVQAAVNTLMTQMIAQLTLAAPAAGVILDPQVFRRDAGGNVIANNPITGYLISPYISTQNSRKYTRGI